nr:MAG TPA: Cleavage stimulation factor subunit 1, dimerization domain [Caudoviricetes sp.]
MFHQHPITMRPKRKILILPKMRTLFRLIISQMMEQ